MWKSLLKSFLLVSLTVASITISTHAAFITEATVSGLNFTTGSAALKLFGNLGYTNAGNNGNLTQTLPGKGFTDIGPNWSSQYLLKFFNTGTIQLMTNLRVVIKNDPGSIADDLLVTIFLWQDTDGNGSLNDGDITTELAAEQPLANLVTVPVNLGQLDPGNPRGILVQLRTIDLPPETQEQQLVVDLVIDGTTEGISP